MSKREWKPGDVAIWPRDDGPGDVIYRFMGGDDWDMPEWQSADQGCAYPNEAILRPAAVIDPDSPEDQRRLLRLLRNCGAFRGVVSEGIALDSLGDALREFANPTPPKPDEPQGLGAVVVAGDGREWIHHGNGKWMRDDACVLPWDSLHIIRVVSEGVVA